MSRCIVRRRSDGLYLAKHHQWIDDPQKARVFTQTGHARNALAEPVATLWDAPKYWPWKPEDWARSREAHKNAASLRRQKFDDQYELILIEVKLCPIQS